MLDDRPREDEGPADGEEPPTSVPFNPLYAIGGAVVAVIFGLMAVSGLLIPVAVLAAALGLFILVQVVIFKVFPPRKSDEAR